MGIEPTHPGDAGMPTDLKSARATRPRALPRADYAGSGFVEAGANAVLSCAPSDRGAVAQLGERLNGIQEVDGSIPFSSTITVAVVRTGSGSATGARLGNPASTERLIPPS